MTKHKHKHKHKHNRKHKHKHKDKDKDKDKGKDTERRKDEPESLENIPKRDAISLDDYYIKNTEFRAWLHSHGKHFDEVRSPRRRYFPKFAEKWNEGELESRFYKGDFSHDEKVQSLTGYHWGFEKDLELPQPKDTPGADTKSRMTTGSSRRNSDQDQHSSRKRDEVKEEKEFRQDVARFNRKRQRQRDQSVHEAAMDEVAPRVTGRERELQKRREKAEKIHGSAQEKDELRDGAAGYSDDFLMGGTGNSLERLKQNRRMREERKTQQRQDRLQELREKESQRMKRFKQAMGLMEGQEIVIRPRND